MDVFDLQTEVTVGDDPELSTDAAQKSANTQDQDQDDDPETSEAEKARIWAMLGMNPNDEAGTAEHYRRAARGDL